MSPLAETRYGRVHLEEAGHPTIEVQAGKTANVVGRFEEKIQYYNQLLNVHLTVKSKPQVQDIAISDGIIQVNPLTAGGIRNEDFLLLHEAAHDKQKTLLGFQTTEALINSFTQDLTTTEIGARDWVERYTMPPFIVSLEDQPLIFGYYQEELRTSLARGIRDIHSDVIALRNRTNIYLTDKEKKDGMDSEKKFLSQFHDELTANVPWYDYRLVQDTEPDFIRKMARFKAVAAGSAQFFKSDDGPTGEKYDAYLKSVFGETSSQYQIYIALSKAYQAYFLSCIRRTDLIDLDKIVQALDSNNSILRARAADFLGEIGNVRMVKPLMNKINGEKNDFVKWNMLSALCDIAGRNMMTDDGWNAVKYLYAFEVDAFAQAMRAIRAQQYSQKECSVREQLSNLLRSTPKERVRDVFHILLSPNSTLPQADKVLEGIALKHPDKAVTAMTEIVRGWCSEWNKMPMSKTVRTWYEEDKEKTFKEQLLDNIKLQFSIVISSVAQICENVLWKTYPDEGLNLMEALLTFPVEDNKANILLDMGNAGFKRPDRTLDILEKHISSKNPKERDWALHSTIILGFVRPERVMHILENASSDKESYFDPPDYQGNIGATVIIGIAKLWNVAPEKVSGIMTTFASSSDLFYRASALDAILEILSVPQGERLHDILRIDEASVKEDILIKRGGELLGLVESLVNDSNPGLRFAALKALKSFTHKEAARVYNILSLRIDERNPTVLGMVISAVGEFAAIDSSKSLMLLERMMDTNPLMQCYGGVQTAVAAALRHVTEHGGDVNRVLDHAIKWEEHANKFYSKDNEKLVKNAVKAAIVLDKNTTKIIGPRSTTDYLIADEIESLTMEGKVRPIAGIKFPEDKLGVVRVDVSRAFIETIGFIGKSELNLSKDCILVLWDLFKSREPAIIMDIVTQIGEIGTVNPDYSLYFLKPMIEGDNPFLKEWGLRAINKFANQRQDEVLGIAKHIMKVEGKDLKSILAETYGIIGKARPDESVYLLTELLVETDSSIIWQATDSLFEIATPEQLNAIYNNPKISNEARNRIREQLTKEP